MAHFPDADPDRLGVDEPRRAVQDLRRARGRRRRRARKADGDEPDDAWERQCSSTRQARLAHPGHHASARAPRARVRRSARRPPPLRRAGETERSTAASPSARRPAARARRRRPARAPAALPPCRSSSSSTSASRSALAFAEWLDGQTPHRVSYARDGEPLCAARGRVVMAPPEPPPRRPERPAGRSPPTRSGTRAGRRSMFSSSRSPLDFGAARGACLLTGMGQRRGRRTARRSAGPAAHDRPGRGDVRRVRHAARGGRTWARPRQFFRSARSAARSPRSSPTARRPS